MLALNTAERAIEYDPDLTVPRRFQQPRRATQAARLRSEREQLTSRKKALEREAQPILNELAKVREQLAALPIAA